MSRNRWEQRPYRRAAHVHRWKLASKQPRQPRSWDYFEQSWSEAEPMKLRRVCEDCGARQMTEVSAEREHELTPGYEAIFDTTWTDEGK